MGVGDGRWGWGGTGPGWGLGQGGTASCTDLPWGAETLMQASDTDWVRPFDKELRPSRGPLRPRGVAAFTGPVRRLRRFPP